MQHDYSLEKCFCSHKPGSIQRTVFVSLHPLYIRDTSCFCNITAVWGSAENTARTAIHSHSNLMWISILRKWEDKKYIILKTVITEKVIFPQQLLLNLETECIQMKDKWFSSSFSTPAFSPSSKQIRQLPRTQSETQRWVTRSTIWHIGILFCFLVSRLSYSTH